MLKLKSNSTDGLLSEKRTKDVLNAKNEVREQKIPNKPVKTFYWGQINSQGLFYKFAGTKMWTKHFSEVKNIK